MGVSPGFPRIIFLAARLRNLDVVGLAGSVGIPAESLADPDLDLPLPTLLALWQEAARRAGEPSFGLHAAEDLQRTGVVGLYGLLGMVSATSADLESGLLRFCRYHELLGDRNVTYSVDDDGATGRIRTTWPGIPEALRHHVEFNTAVGVMRVRGLTGFELAPRVFRFRHTAPAELTLHRRLFPAPIEFGAAHDEVVFDRELLSRPLCTADPVLCAVLERRARDLVARVALGGMLAEQVTRHLARALPGGDVDLDSVARALETSPRTLQRRLGEEGTSFAQLLDATRRSLALSHLADGEVSVAEIAFLLGYSEPAAFHRAFHRWTGTTPRAYRHRGEVSADAREA